MRPMMIAAGTISGVAGAIYLGYRKNLEQAEIEKQLLLNIEQQVERTIDKISKLAEKIDELKEKVVHVADVLKQVGDLPEKKDGDLPEEKGGGLDFGGCVGN